MKKLIPAIVLLLISAIVMSTASYAWFSMNTVVTATGMKVKATTSSSLVIAGQANVETAVTYAFAATATSPLIPTTHMDTFTNTGDASATPTTNFLAHITNGADVSAATGYAPSYVYADSTNDGTNMYYVDYSVFIAAAGAALDNQDLTVTFDADTITAILAYVDVTNDTRKATSVDFYAKLFDASNAAQANSTTLAKSDYKATLNFANCGTVSAPTSVTLLSGESIPQNGNSGHYLKVTMRVYIDGALQKTAAEGTTPAQAYVYTDHVDVNDAELGVVFTATAHTGS